MGRPFHLIRNQRQSELAATSIPVIDLFAGPGGLGEGFSAFSANGGRPFQLKLSVEKDPIAHQTLELRAFFRHFPHGEAPEAYYRFLQNGGLGRSELFDRYPAAATQARAEAWHAELGIVQEAELDNRIRASLPENEPWVLIGGPPCQAYSVVGRSRRGGMDPKDPRVHLYKQYLRILAVHRPHIFVMENVKGLLSSKIGDEWVFERIMTDLSAPNTAFPKTNRSPQVDYTIHSIQNIGDRLPLSSHHATTRPSDFIIECERYGIPQARHRVVLVGVRSDLAADTLTKLRPRNPVALSQILDGLPRIRSGLSREVDSFDAWSNILKGTIHSDWFEELNKRGDWALCNEISDQTKRLSKSPKDRGGQYLEGAASCEYRKRWYTDTKLKGVCNHESRLHISKDLERYFFAACFAIVNKKSPRLEDFPPQLLPDHGSVADALSGAGYFADRFRVQVDHRPATTVTSHISKDGHYYIHPDPNQCRSLTVREAARIQTFPDNYFFCGPRTQQYHQVGNAVPPLLARQLAGIVFDALAEQ